METSGQRIDKWLWYTRLFKSRSLAARFVEQGKVRVKSSTGNEKLTKPSQIVRPEDVLTFSLHSRIRIIKVIEPGTRRGPASEAQLLYEDLSPEVETQTNESNTDPAQRERGSGRPTKKDRRALDWLLGRDA